ncbi:WD repeat-containing protein 36-like [Amphibalanus amphitrite]|uniref:WD repeat-containing protein 36-like n=1 Tax=Amphibalanus amphitrite TaxID=1232801 RepID=UPI001C909FD1|nr:WD repeat-containing protein 36-like [Amphibalanus amphitrite]XP_043225559.1 WD repeat-containing protein 36-like [Amphibalanus amphitrite]XP_043225560.1 WD repeat-containing protein 36-like [Amphibalanus amphitrite]XP_043225561.1 WD repeat-containing protein 36-like [Amphibalanus amphitrite]XP_043225562.1 WD repeat-containing protein 36-like [Amphibalanus amphitrite]XP_043225563.1 WD repeat-containing protein 36-like [Amphibalanus amphitrite]
MPTSSKIFKGYRALGFVSNHVPLLVRYIHKRKENLIITCVGKSFHTYACSRLQLLSVSEPHEADIEVMAADRALVYTAVRRTVRAWRRGTELVHTYPEHSQPVHLLLPFGPHLITVDMDSTLRVWDINSEELYTELSFSNASFRVTCLAHPSTYLNKVLLGSEQGSLELWNLRTSRRVHTFTGWGAAVTALEQAPAVDVMAVGLASGEMILHNLRFDETLMRFQQEWGPVTSLAFRTDGQPVMISGSTQGHVALWDLEERKLLGQMWEAHQGSVTGMAALPSEPLLVTSSPDNSLKVWIFDMPDGGGRLLRARGGHSAPSTFIRFYDERGNILSAGQDSTIRVFSSENDAVSRSFGQASYNRKLSKKRRAGVHDTLTMPPVVSLAASTVREKEWDNIAAVHRGVAQVTTWSFDKQRMGEHRLLPDRLEGRAGRAAAATCADITACGNFVVIGYSTGHVDRFNIQSGLARGSYGDPGHEGAVRGVATTGLVHQVLSAGADSQLKFWRLKTGQLLHSLTLDAPAARMVLHRESSLAAVALDDFSACVVDADGRRVVRRFAGHGGPLTDLCLSPDGAWLLTAGMDCCVRVWSLPQAALVDVLRTDTAPTSVTLGPAGRLLATTHVDDTGVYLWANRTLFDYVSLPPLPADYVPSVAPAPGSAPDDGVVLTAADGEEEEEEVKVDVEEEYACPQQLADQLVTLSLLPESRWAHLLNVDAILKRNKPKEAPKAPKSAPFFLPTVSGLETKFDLSDAAAAEGAADSERILHLGALAPVTELGRLLLKAETGDDEHYDAVMTLLKTFGPWQLDSELRQLAPAPGSSPKLLRLFLVTLHHQLDSCRDFELAQAYLGLFLKLHGPAISESLELRNLVDKLSTSQAAAWERLQGRINSALCLVSFLRSSTIS